MEDRQVSLKQVLDTVDEMPIMKDNNGMEFIEKSLVKTRIGMLQPELNEWCTDCKEYDQERHCCPRFNKVIRETVEEYKAEHPEPCEDAVSREDVINFLCDWICAPGVRCNESSDKCGCIRGIKALLSVTPKQRWILCVNGNEPKANADCWISTNANYVRRASYAPKVNNQPNGFIVTEGGFGFYEYGKSAKAWMPYEEPEPYREEGD